jgi:membrane fusion protein (multidrug efflux system)
VLNTLQSVGSNWLVDDGIADGDRLIVDGLQKIRDGEDVASVEVTLDEDGVVQRAGAADASTPAKN